MSSIVSKGKRKKNKKNVGQSVLESLMGYLFPLYAVIFFVFVPLYMKEGYYQIGTAKYHAYSYIFMIGMPVAFILCLFWCINTFMESELPRTPIWTYVKQQISVIDIFVLAFCIASVLSFVISPYKSSGFWGYDGWFMGLFSQITFVIIYLVFSRFGMGWQVSLSILCTVTFIAYVIGILHRMMIDPIGVYENISDFYKGLFLSTLGQASWYSSFVCTVMPLGVVGFFLARKIWLRILCAIFTLAAFTTMVSQNSDSAYIAFGFMMLALLWAAVDSSESMMRYFEVLLLFSIAPKFMNLLLKIHPNPILDLDTLSNMLIFSNLEYLLILISAIGVAVFYLLHRKGRSYTKILRILRNVLYGIVLILLVTAIFILRAGTTGQLSPAFADLAQKVPYLVFDDEWGNGRGFTWIASAKIFKEMEPVRKIFGTGPDCFASYAYEFYSDYIRSKWGDNILQNAHNEWLNMLVNQGILGIVTYLGIFVSAFVRFMKNWKKSPLLLASAVCVAAYVGHNIFCYQQVLCTPFIFFFIAYAEYELRKADHSGRE